MIQSKTFSERVVELALSIPEGRVTTYGALAKAAGGGERAAMSITSILGRAYKKGQADIPFHRIVYSDGRVWMNESYKERRLKQYEDEGIELDSKGRIVNFYDIVV